MAENPESTSVGSRDRLLIKVVLPKQARERRVSGGGGPLEPLREVDEALRSSLALRTEALRSVIADAAAAFGSVPIRVQLIDTAYAKSHRPKHLFSSKSCPIIGAGGLGELYVSATPQGLHHLKETFTSASSPQLVKDISTVQTIEAITPTHRLRGLQSLEVLRTSPRLENGFAVRVQLFDDPDPGARERLHAGFYRECTRRGIQTHQGGYSDASSAIEAVCRDSEDLKHLSRIVSVRRLSRMPLLRTLRPSSVTAVRTRPEMLPAPELPLTSYPAVAVVDTGIGRDVRELSPWILGRETTVAPAYRNERHGTFVAGLVCFGKQLNPHLQSIDDEPCAVLDVQVLPNIDPGYGEIEELRESEFLQALERALARYGDSIKVWNMSLSTDEVCSLDEFSALAVELDRLQEQYRVTFVVSAGNYETPPLLPFPRTGDLVASGRITAPADSVLAVTVGSVSHATQSRSAPAPGEPSAFSRHGPGPNFVIKPDIVHYGGACELDGSDALGVNSITLRGVEQDVGTSFSTPLVSRHLANIYHKITPSPSPELVRALLAHHARDPRTGGRVADTDENYLGFGVPSVTPLCLECSPWLSTLVFQDQLRPGYYLEWDDFPFPSCLRKGDRYFGEIWMTVAFTPARGSAWGTEYCETHIDAHMGVYQERRKRKTGAVSLEFAGKVPPEHKNPGALYESYQVETMRKWAPTRTYYGRLDDSGVRGVRWRLKVQLLCRHELDEINTSYAQPFALIVTIADPGRKADVYDDMARAIRSRFKIQNLQVRPEVRVRGQA